MKEAECCTRIVNGFLDAGHEALKIPDAPRTKYTKFSVKKGYDITASIKGDALCVEVKINPSLPKKLSSFMNLMEDSQIKRFDRVTKNKNAQCFAFLVVFKNNRKASLRRHDLYIIPWSKIMKKQWRPETMKPLKCFKERYDLSAFFDSFPRF